MELDDRILEILKCGVCNNTLSYGPIRLEGAKNICGRCSAPGSSQNIPYETLAGLVKFPCRYRGCSEKLNVAEMTRHEDKCALKTITCPASDACEWKGTLQRLRYHYEEEHQNFLFEIPCTFKPNAPRTEEHNLLLTWEGVTFLMKIKADEQRILHDIGSIEDSTTVFQFILEIHNDLVSLRRKSRRTNDRYVLETNVNHLESVGEYGSLNFRLTCEKVTAPEVSEHDNDL